MPVAGGTRSEREPALWPGHVQRIHPRLDGIGTPESGLAGERSPLAARNRSLLAHGFDSIGAEVYQGLYNKLVLLAGFENPSEPWSLPETR